MRLIQFINTFLSFIERKNKQTLIIIVLLAFCSRVFWVFVINPIRNPGSYSGDHYYIIAENLVNGHGYVDGVNDEKISDLRRLPVYTFVLAGSYKIFGVNYIAPIIMNCIFEALSCILIYLLAMYLFRREKIALISALMYAVYVRGYFMSAKLITEPLYIFLLLLFMYSYFYWLKNFNVKNGLLTGFILGIITLTRATTQFFPFIVLITIFWHKKGIKKITINYICFIIAFALVLAPWVYRNYLVTGTANLIVSSDYGYALWEKTQFDFDMLVHRDSKTYSKIVSELNTINQSHDGNNYKAADTMVRIFLDDLIKNPSKHIFLYFKQLIAFWYIAPSKTISIINMLINFPFLILGVMGLKKALKNGITVTPFIALITYFNLLHAIVWVFFRYAIPLMPYLMIFSSYFLLTNKYFYSSRLEERKMELSV